MTSNTIAGSLGLQPMPLTGQLISANVPSVPMPAGSQDQQITNDFDHARTNIYDVISQGHEALFDLIQLAKQSQQPRAYEIVAGLMKTLVDANKDLLDIQGKKKELLEKEDDAPKGDTHNHLYVGSTNDLLKLLKKKDTDDGSEA